MGTFNNETADDDFPFTPTQYTSDTMASRNEHLTPDNQESPGNSEIRATDRNMGREDQVVNDSPLTDCKFGLKGEEMYCTELLIELTISSYL